MYTIIITIIVVWLSVYCCRLMVFENSQRPNPGATIKGLAVLNVFVIGFPGRQLYQRQMADLKKKKRKTP